MSVWYTATITVRGSKEQVLRIRQLVDEHTHDERGEQITRFDDITEGGTTSQWEGFRWRWPEDDAAYENVVWMGEFASDPPDDILSWMSREYPECEFEMMISDEYSMDENAYLYQSGISRPILIQDGCFEFREQNTAPVHHWKFSLFIEGEEFQGLVRTALREHGLIMEHAYTTMYRQDGERILSWINERFPHVQAQIEDSLPYTLNEDYYLGEVYDEMTACGRKLMLPQPLRITRDFEDLLSVAERDIELTNVELNWLAEDLVGQMSRGEHIQRHMFPRVERLRNHLGREQFDERYLPLLTEGLQSDDEQFVEQWFISPSVDESVDRGYGHPYKPTKAELELLLSHYEQNPGLPNAVARVTAINEAIQSPRWTREWPRWEQDQRERETRQRDRQNVGDLPLMTDEEFLRALEDMDGGTLSRRESSTKVNWRAEGF